MKKSRLLLLFLACAMILCGCSSSADNPSSSSANTPVVTENPLPFSRKKEASKDRIRFYEFDWLEDFQTIREKFDQDFGSDSYEIEEGFYFVGDAPDVQEKDIGLMYRSFTFYGKNKSPLMWKIAGNDLMYLRLYCISGDSGEHWHLVEGVYHFYQPTLSMKDDLKAKLKKLYFLPTEKTTNTSYRATFTDDNDNTADLFFTELQNNTQDKYALNIVYTCNEVRKTILKKLYEKPEESLDTSGL